MNDLEDARRAYEQLTAQMGRPPTVSEMVRTVGHSAEWVRARMKRAGLEAHHMTAQEYAKAAMKRQNRQPAPSRRTEIDGVAAANEAQSIRHRRIMQLMAEPGEGPKNERAGSGFGPNQIIRTRCACCGQPLSLCPHTWPHYGRRRDGTIFWLCGYCDEVGG